MPKPKLRQEPKDRWSPRGPKITIIETEKGERYTNIPSEDFDVLMDLYDSLPHPKIQNPNWDFALNLTWRIYSEWCMSPNEGVAAIKRDWRAHANYSGEGFIGFITQETHQELTRQGYQWNGQENRFENINDQQYQQARQRVLGGLVLRAVELFSDWTNNYPPSRQEKDERGFTKYLYDDQRNLRTDLRDYVKQYQELQKQSRAA